MLRLSSLTDVLGLVGTSSENSTEKNSEKGSCAAGDKPASDSKLAEVEKQEKTEEAKNLDEKK